MHAQHYSGRKHETPDFIDRYPYTTGVLLTVTASIGFTRAASWIITNDANLHPLGSILAWLLLFASGLTILAAITAAWVLHKDQQSCPDRFFVPSSQSGRRQRTVVKTK